MYPKHFAHHSMRLLLLPASTMRSGSSRSRPEALPTNPFCVSTTDRNDRSERFMSAVRVLWGYGYLSMRSWNVYGELQPQQCVWGALVADPRQRRLLKSVRQQLIGVTRLNVSCYQYACCGAMGTPHCDPVTYMTTPGLNNAFGGLS